MFRVPRCYHSGCSAADGEVAYDGHFQGIEDGHEIVQDRVDHGFVEDAFIAVRQEIELEAFHFHAALVGDVIDGDGGEVRLAGDGAHAGEFGEDEFHLVFPPRARVGEGVQNRARLGGLRFSQDRLMAQMSQNLG